MHLYDTIFSFVFCWFFSVSIHNISFIFIWLCAVTLERTLPWLAFPHPDNEIHVFGPVCNAPLFTTINFDVTAPRLVIGDSDMISDDGITDGCHSAFKVWYLFNISLWKLKGHSEIIAVTTPSIFMNPKCLHFGNGIRCRS